MTGRWHYLLIDASANELHHHADAAVALAGDVSILSSNWRAGLIQERCAAGNLVREITWVPRGSTCCKLHLGRLRKGMQIPEEIHQKNEELDGTEKATQKATEIWWVPRVVRVSLEAFGQLGRRSWRAGSDRTPMGMVSFSPSRLG
jgi:hypothetical protein